MFVQKLVGVGTNPIAFRARGAVAYYTCTYRFAKLAKHKKMTITLDAAVYDGLYRIAGRRRMSGNRLIKFPRAQENAAGWPRTARSCRA